MLYYIHVLYFVICESLCWVNVEKALLQLHFHTLPDAERWEYAHVKLALDWLSYLEQLPIIAQLFVNPIVISTTVIKQHERVKYTCRSLICASFLKKQVSVKLKSVKYELEVWRDVGERCVKKKNLHCAAHITQIHYMGWNLRIPLKMMKRCLSLVSDESLRVCMDLKTLWRLLLQVFKFIHQWNSHEPRQFVRLRLSSLGGWGHWFDVGKS